jgi:hypothetical protein
MFMLRNNRELLRIFHDDQKDRKVNQNKRGWLSWVTARDCKRRQMVAVLLRMKKVKTAADFYHAAMIFHHGARREHIVKAKQLARRSITLRSEKGKWLYAAATDRLLIMSGKKQKFGTQYRFMKKGGMYYYELLPVDSGTTNEERRRFGVKPLERIKKFHIDK